MNLESKFEMQAAVMKRYTAQEKMCSNVPNPPPALLSATKGDSLGVSLSRMSSILRYSAFC